jgi:L-arabinokinase
LEVATLRALQGLLTPALDQLDGLRLAALAQRAEQEVALAPCGIMDQATAALGQRERLLVLCCQPCELLAQRPLPRDVRVFGIDTGHTHRVSDGQYGRVRAATFMGRAIIAARAASAGGEDPPDGYLCNLKPEHFLAEYAAHLPEVVTGAEFLASYGEHGDTATRIEEEIAYHVRTCTAHPIFEQANVNVFLAALDRYKANGEMAALLEAGDAMYRSHESYSRRCGLGTPETDRIVVLARERGAARGIFGAKITGGGGGGTVAILARGRDVEIVIAEIAAAYATQTGKPARVFVGSEDGAMYWAPERLNSIVSMPVREE